jgi:iron complex outermembrane receptor protein
MKIWVFLSAVMVGGGVPMLAQDPAPERGVTRLDEVIVRSTPLGNILFEQIQPVSVFEGTELRRRAGSTLGDTLWQEPGISSSFFGPGANRPVIRGLDGDRVRILQNGTGVLDASSLSVDHAVAVEPLFAERIEILRGPASLLYGTSAMGGVVNVMDNRIPDKPMDAPLSGKLQGAGDSASTDRSFAGMVEGGVKGFAYHVDGVVRRSDDQNIPGFVRSQQLRDRNPLPPGEREPRGTLENSHAETASATAGASYHWSQGYAGAAYNNYRTAYGTVAEPNVHIELEQHRLDLGGDFREPVGGLQAVRWKAALTEYEHTEFEGPDPGTVFQNKGYDARVDVPHEDIGPVKGAFGFQSFFSDFSAVGEEAFLPPTKTYVNSGFVMEEWELSPVKLQGSGRWDLTHIQKESDPFFGPSRDRDFVTFGLSGGIVYTPAENYAVALSAACTRRAPQAQELFANGPHIATNAFEVGNPDFDPEEVLGFDLTIRKQAGWVTGEASAFYNRYDNFITLVPTGALDPVDGLPIYQFTGLPADFAGFEGLIRFHLVEPETADGHGFHIELKGDYVHAQARDTHTPLPRMPPLRMGGGLVYAYKNFGARLDVLNAFNQNRTAPGELGTDGYTLVTVALSYRQEAGPVVMEYFLKANNLADEEIRQSTSFLKDIAPQPGIGASGGVRVLF